MLKGTPLKQRDARWHNRHSQKLKKRKRLRILHMEQSEIVAFNKAKEIDKIVREAKKKRTWWVTIINYIKKIYARFKQNPVEQNQA